MNDNEKVMEEIFKGLTFGAGEVKVEGIQLNENEKEVGK